MTAERAVDVDLGAVLRGQPERALGDVAARDLPRRRAGLGADPLPSAPMMRRQAPRRRDGAGAAASGRC